MRDKQIHVDNWSKVNSIAYTALGTAAARAIETAREDALTVDPYAALLVEASGD